ncbi:UNVERIFIED_CONTAM: putative calcium-binding protein CML11 [Sesamum angustifolium]|uniref:Calcium-binding protein CML11 n=1 Tax=Sesamum angustifolium TaxID=2727405 RepID=A0AAW2M994_9LAMI
MSSKEPAVNLDDEQLAELREIFRSFDRNNDGSLTELELGSLLRSLGLKPSPDQLDALIQRADTNSNGLVEFSEFRGAGGAGAPACEVAVHGGAVEAPVQDV